MSVIQDDDILGSASCVECVTLAGTARPGTGLILHVRVLCLEQRGSLERWGRLLTQREQVFSWTFRTAMSQHVLDFSVDKGGAHAVASDFTSAELFRQTKRAPQVSVSKRVIVDMPACSVCMS